MSGHRLGTGGRIDRHRPIDFYFDGELYRGYAGDTLASALLASGLRIFGRSSKLHRPRGLLSAGIEESNALVQLGNGAAAEPSVRATMVALQPGLAARSQNAWPSREFDVGRLLDVLWPLWPAGFYNKTFKWPSWRTYEGLVRRATGLGRTPPGADPDRYEHCNAHCDVLVVGGGPAGLAAALAAGAAGARVLLVEQDREFGGSLLFERASIDGGAPDDWLKRTLAALDALPEVRRLAGTTAFGCYDHDVVALNERCPAGDIRERHWRVRVRQIVLATGAIEQPLVFACNDRPGIMLAGAVRHYLNRYAVAAGQRIVIATNNDSAYRTALDLDAAGVSVQAVIDSRGELAGALPRQAIESGIAVHRASQVSGSRGGHRGLAGVVIGRLTSRAGGLEHVADIDCDVLAMSGGWAPALHLYSQARGRLRYEDAVGAFVADRGPDNLQVVGGAAGSLSLRESIVAAVAAGAQAARACGFVAAGELPLPAIAEARPTPMQDPLRRSASGRSARQWIDFQHDVTVADIELAVRENYVSVEHLKRYTTAGMSVDQGKTGNLNALSVLAELTGRRIDELGTTTFRPPYTPVAFGAIAGRHVGERYSPARELPAVDWHRAHGAVFEDAGGWRRPTCYLRAGEDTVAAIHREILAVRHDLGLFDASPLGKIELRGPDAAQFIDRFYINDLRRLEPGRVRYGLMLDENGVIIDDGTVARLAREHFLITTTSGRAGRIAAWLEECRQCEYAGLRVLVTPVTTQWATWNLAGPRARDVLARLAGDIDLSAGRFRHMQLRCGRLEGVPVRLCRVSYSGELGYEINVPAGYAEALAERLIEVGTDSGISPLGLEALLVLRLEKGYLHVGIDTDGTTIPDDVGWGAIAARKQADFIGKRSLQRPAQVHPDRLQLVGLCSRDGESLRAGAHLRLDGTRRGSDGWITSAAYSPTLGRPIALAMLRGGRARIGQRIAVHDQGRRSEAEVTERVFYDRAGERLRG